MKCLLCGDTSHLIKKIITKDIVYEYKKQLNIRLKDPQEDMIGEYQCKSCGLIFFSNEMVGDAEFYEQLQDNKWYYVDEKNEYEVAAKYVKKGDFLLDVGCGKGAFSGYVTEAQYTGLEYDNETVKKNNKQSLNIINKSISEYSINLEHKHDIVCCFQVLEHITNIKQFLEDMISCVRKDGLLVIAVPNNDSFFRKN